jgi:hypothetical protein
MLEKVITKFHKFFWNAVRCSLEGIDHFGRENLEEALYSESSVSLYRTGYIVPQKLIRVKLFVSLNGREIGRLYNTKI